MKIKFLLGFFALLLLNIPQSSCQIDLDRIAREAQRNVNKRVERNIDRSIDNTMDEAEDLVKKKKKKKKKGDDGEYVEIETVTVVKEVIPYSFAGSFLIDRKIKGGEGENNMYMVALEEFQTAVRPLLIKEPHNLMIYDKSAETLTTVNNEDYEGKAMRDWYDLEGAEDKPLELERTDDIKDIDGYIARKYTLDSKGVEGELWLTKEIDANYNVISQVLGLNDIILDAGLGFPLMMDLELKDGSKIEYSVTKISAENDLEIFDLSDYELIDMTDLKHGK